MYMLCFDCEVKKLGEYLIYIDDMWRDKMTNLINELTINNLDVVMRKIIHVRSNTIQIKYAKCVSLIERKTKMTSKSFVDVSVALKKYLSSLDKKFTQYKIDKVLIEFQWNINDKSKAVGRFLEYHYCRVEDGFTALYVPPLLKNKYYFNLLSKLDYSNFISKYSKGYTANKEHTKANFMYYCDTVGYDYSGISRVYDVADAFMMGVAYLINNNIIESYI